MPDSYLKANSVKAHHVSDALRELSGFCVVSDDRVRQWFFKSASKDVLLYVFEEKLDIPPTDAREIAREILESRSFATKKPRDGRGFVSFSGI